MTEPDSAGIDRFDPGAEYFTEEGCFITELRNTPTDADCSIARARVRPGETTRLHSLAGTAERYVILSGQAEVSIGRRAAVRVAPLDVVHIPAGEPQCIRNCGSGDLVFLCICTPRFRTQNYRALEDWAGGRPLA